MVPVDVKLKLFKSGKCSLTPELIERFFKSRSIIFHFLTFLWHILLNYQTLAGVFYILFNRMDLVNKTCGFGIQYVTIWNLVIEQNYFNACLLQDILEFIPDPKYDKIKTFLKKALPYAFSSIVFPLSILVTLNFWGIYSHYPRVIDEDNVTESFFPPWVNHGLHTTNLLLALMEMIVVHRPYPTKFWGFIGLFSVLIGYCVTCTLLYFIGGVWPYPLVQMMSLWQRLFYVTGNCILGYIIIGIEESLNNKIWGNGAIQGSSFEGNWVLVKTIHNGPIDIVELPTDKKISDKEDIDDDIIDDVSGHVTFIVQQGRMMLLHPHGAPSMSTTASAVLVLPMNRILIP